MNDQPSAPMLPPPTGVSAWFTTWMDAVTKPGEQTYAVMAQHPEAASPNRAFIWVFLAGTLAALISGILQAILQASGVVAQIPGMSELFGEAPRTVAATLGVAICAAPISGALAVLFFAIFVGIVQWVARLFGGTGTFSQLAYVAAAISVPFSLVSAVLTPFSTLGTVGYCIGGISLLLGLYVLALQLTAVKAVNNFGWGQALGSYFLPLILIVCLCACIILGLASVLAPAFPDIFNQGFTP